MKISVALCTYNGEKYLQQQIDSILNQSVAVDEIVICDDCSSDSTTSILFENVQKHPDVFRIYINETNLKSNKNFEKAIDLSTGDFIFLSDQDDIWRLDKVEKILQLFERNPAAEGVFSNADFIDDFGNRIETNLDLWSTVNFFTSSPGSSTDFYQSLIYMGNFLTGATLCLKKEAKEVLIPFQTSSNFLHDEWIALVLSKRKTLYFSGENLIHYRLHSDQQVGMGKLKYDRKAVDNKKKYADLILGTIEPKTYAASKKVVKKIVGQYHKYEQLEKFYDTNLFTEVKEFLRARYIKIEMLMKKQNPILFYFRGNKVKI